MRILRNWKQVMTLAERHNIEDVTLYMRPSRRLVEYFIREYPALRNIYIRKCDGGTLKRLTAPNQWEFWFADGKPARPVEVMPEQVKKMTELRGVGLSYRKIAEELGVAPDTAWKHLNDKIKYVRYAGRN